MTCCYDRMGKTRTREVSSPVVPVQARCLLARKPRGTCIDHCSARRGCTPRRHAGTVCYDGQEAAERHGTMGTAPVQQVGTPYANEG